MTGMRYQPQGLALPGRNVQGFRLALSGAIPGRAATGQSITQVGAANRVPAVFGVAQRFNGVNQAISIPLDLRNTEAVTVVALVDALANTGAQQILWEFGADTVGTRQGFDAYVNSSGLLEVWTGSAGTQREGNTYALPVGQHVIACTYDHTQAGGSQVVLYVDGVRQTRTNQSAAGVPRGAFLQSTLYVAARTASSSWANIRLGAFLLFDRVLNPSEIPAYPQNVWQFFDGSEDEDYLTTVAASYSLSVQPAAMAVTAVPVAARIGRKLTVGAAPVSVVASPVGLRASRNLPIVPVALTFAAGNVVVRASRRFGALPAGMAVTGYQVVARVSRRLSVTPAAMAMTGSQVTMQYIPKPAPGAYTLPVSVAATAVTGGAVGARFARRLRIESASLTLSTFVVRALIRRRLAISPAGSQLVGAAVVLTYGALDGGQEIDALLVPPRQTVVFEGSRRVVAFEGGKRVVSFEGSKRMVDFQ